MSSIQHSTSRIIQSKYRNHSPQNRQHYSSSRSNHTSTHRHFPYKKINTSNDDFVNKRFSEKDKALHFFEKNYLNKFNKEKNKLSSYYLNSGSLLINVNEQISEELIDKFLGNYNAIQLTNKQKSSIFLNNNIDIEDHVLKNCENMKYFKWNVLYQTEV